MHRLSTPGTLLLAANRGAMIIESASLPARNAPATAVRKWLSASRRIPWTKMNTGVTAGFLFERL